MNGPYCLVTHASRFFLRNFTFIKKFGIIYIRLLERNNYMKFISSYYDEKDGDSMVVIQHLGKKFIGEASVHPDDKEIASSYAGCEYAELRAKIKALKYERKIEKAKADAALDFVHSCECYKNFIRDSKTAKTIYRQLNRRIAKVNKLADEINELYKQIEQKQVKRQIILNAVKHYKSKKTK